MNTDTRIALYAGGSILLTALISHSLSRRIAELERREESWLATFESHARPITALNSAVDALAAQLHNHAENTPISTTDREHWRRIK